MYVYGKKSTKIFESLFILSGAYLLLNAASYDGEIPPYAGHALGFMSIGDSRYENNDICSKKCV